MDLRGKFIAFYGVNNVGKSTHVRLLEERLTKEGFETVILKYPIYDLEPTGPFLDSVLRSHKQQVDEETLQMFFTLNRFHYQSEVVRMLDEGKTILAEDYIGTGVAWGSAKGADEEWLIAMNKPLRRADLSILLQGERALKAREEIHIHETNDKLVTEVGATLDRLADQFDWQRVQVCPTKQKTADVIYELIQKNFS